jgi:hypothetical protein
VRSFAVIVVQFSSALLAVSFEPIVKIILPACVNVLVIVAKRAIVVQIMPGYHEKSPKRLRDSFCRAARGRDTAAVQ